MWINGHLPSPGVSNLAVQSTHDCVYVAVHESTHGTSATFVATPDMSAKHLKADTEACKIGLQINEYTA